MPLSQLSPVGPREQGLPPGESWHPRAHTTLAMTSFSKEEMVPRGHLALTDSPAQLRQHCQTHRAATSREAPALFPSQALE